MNRINRRDWANDYQFTVHALSQSRDNQYSRALQLEPITQQDTQKKKSATFTVHSTSCNRFLSMVNHFKLTYYQDLFGDGIQIK